MFTSRVMVCLKQVVHSLDDSHKRFLFGKLGIDLHGPHGEFVTYDHIEQVVDGLNGASDRRLIELVEDLIGNRQYYRSGVSPRYHFDVPQEDLARLVRLEGWGVSGGRLRRTEGGVVDLQTEEDLLVTSLRDSGLPNLETILAHLTRSADDYARDNNSSLTNSRQALELLLQDIAQVTATQRGEAAPRREDVRNYLENCGFLTQEEKRGFSGAYGFLSQGPHPGIADEEMARLGRNFTLGACHYALQKFARWAQGGYRQF